MNKILFAASLLLASTIGINAASPSYDNFSSGDFQRIGNSVKLRPVLTNQVFATNLVGTVPGSDPNALTNDQSTAVNFANSITATEITSSGGISAVSGITSSAGGITNLSATQPFSGNAGGLTNVPAASLTGTASVNTTGHAATATAAGIVTNGDLSINVDSLPGLDQALRYSNTISVIVFGDSIGAYIWQSLPRFMDRHSTFPTALGALKYPAYNAGWAAWSGITTTTQLDIWWHANSILVVSNSAALGTNIWSVNNGFPSTGKLNGNLLKFWYVATATNGTIAVDTSTNGSTWTQHTEIDESALARGLYCTNIPLATDDYYVRVRSVTGRAEYLWVQLVNTNTKSFHISDLSAGGRTMGSFVDMGNNMDVIITNLWPAPTMFVWMDTKDLYTYTNWPTIFQKLTNYWPKADIVLGKPQPSLLTSVETNPASGTYYQSVLFNEMARTNRIAFVDSRSSFTDTNRSVALGWYSDFIHLNANGQAALADDFWTRLKWPHRVAMTDNFVLNRDGTNVTVWSSLRVLDASNGSRHYAVSNAWTATRMGVFFSAPNVSGGNYKIAGDENNTALRSGSGVLQIFTGSGGLGGAQWQASGGLSLWGSGYARANEDAGIGGLIVSGNQTNYGNLVNNSAGGFIGNGAGLTNINLGASYFTNAAGSKFQLIVNSTTNGFTFTPIP